MQTGYPCPYCGFIDHPEDANYCGKCGKEIKFTHLPEIRVDYKILKLLYDLSDIPRPFIVSSGPHSYTPRQFLVVDKNEYNTILSVRDYALNKIKKIEDFINLEQQNSKKLFGGKSKTEILNRIKDIVS